MSKVNNKIKEENNPNINTDDYISEKSDKLGSHNSIEVIKKMNRKKIALSKKNCLEKEFIIFKKKFSLKSLLFIGISIILFIILILIIVVATKKKKTNDKEKENIMEFNYDEAEKLIGIELTKNNHDLLKENNNNISKLINICGGVNYTKINIDMLKNSDFSKDIDESSLHEIDKYISKIEKITEQTNKLTEKQKDIFNEISDSLFVYKNESNNIIQRFENNIKNLSIPLLNNSNYNLRRLIDGDLLKIYIEEIEKLNSLYYYYFKAIKEDFANITYIINTILEKDIFLKNEILMISDRIMKIITESKYEKLIEIKNSFISLYIELDSMKNEIQMMRNIISKFNDSLSQEESDILQNIQNLMLQMGNTKQNDLIILNLINSEIDKNTPTQTNLIQALNSLSIMSKYIFEDSIDNIMKMSMNISLSIDLLFIVDNSKSMEPYIEKIKTNINNIINGIIKECPEIIINLGFIGYSNNSQNSYDIEFTYNHTYYIDIINNFNNGKNILNNDIKNGDVSFVFKSVLKKKWKSKNKLAVFITDKPSNEKDIEEMIKEMSEKNIALFCLRMNDSMNKMLQLFKDIYNKKIPNNILFQIIDNKNLYFSDYVINYVKKIYPEMSQNIDEKCLLSKNKTIEILKNNYKINNENPDNNIRFILGKCSPVLLIPGIYATKLKVELNCRGLATEEKDTTLKNIRLFCGEDICKDLSKTSEEHPLLFSLLDEAFGISSSNSKKYGACLGHILTYFQNENECPKVGNKNICHYSKYVKVGYYGGTKNTLNEGRCGVEGITNVIQEKNAIFNSLISAFSRDSGSFSSISDNLIRKGYKEGFSLGGLPNDFRRYLATNNFASKVFEYQINNLYENTGKPVVIIAHSYGALLALTNLLKNKNDTIFLKKIKKFIAMAPPFSGSTELLNVFFHGTKDFDKNIQFAGTKYPIFGQYIMYKSLPIIMELRPLPIAAKIFTDSVYKELGDTLRNRLYCENKTCYSYSINEKFDNIFKGYFPSLTDPECNYHSNLESKNTFNGKCYTYIYNVGDCPTIITKSVNLTQNDYEKDLFCNKTGKEYFYQGEFNNNEKNGLDEVYYSDKCPNVYNNKEAINFLIDRFNNHFSKIYGEINENYFDSYETIKSGVKNLLEYQKNIDLIKELPVPPVDTELLYASFYPTISTLILDDDDFTKEGTYLRKGGDGTVPTWSSLLTGFKWIYDKKKNNLTQKIKLIEYCSRLSDLGQYKYNPNKEQNFGAISCECLDSDTNIYNDKEKCSHAGMLHDNYLIEYINSIVNDPKENIYENFDSKKEAIEKYNPENDYEGVCNNNISNFLDTAK